MFRRRGRWYTRWALDPLPLGFVGSIPTAGSKIMIEHAALIDYVCGEDFCDVCGDCMHCNDEFPCWVADVEGTKPHMFVEAIDEN